MSLTSRLLLGGAFAFGRANEKIERLRGAVRALGGAFLARALDDSERTALSIALYDASAKTLYRGGSLFDWEVGWLSKRLPTAPAKVLVAGAGAGREVAALARLGYDVHAFDPAPSAVHDCVARVQGRVLAVVATYQELCASVLDGAATRADSFRDARYDAVLLGWGSIPHILDARDRERALRACAALAPTGPLLCSFLLSRTDGPQDGRAARIGHWLGEPVRRIRHAHPAEATDIFVPELGFLHGFAQREIDELGAATGRRVERDTVAIGYQYATLLPWL